MIRAGIAAACLLAAPVAAEESLARCAVVGPLAVSGYIDFLSSVASKNREAATTAAGRVTALIDLHDRLGCEPEALTGALECLTARIVGGATLPPADIAQSCMGENGMAIR